MEAWNERRSRPQHATYGWPQTTMDALEQQVKAILI